MGSALIHDGGPLGAPALSAHSRFVQRIRRRYAAELPLLPPGVPDAATASPPWCSTLRDGGRALPSALRVARQLVLERLAVLDVEQAAPLDDVTAGMTALAEATLELALAQAAGRGRRAPRRAAATRRASASSSGSSAWASSARASSTCRPTST